MTEQLKLWCRARPFHVAHKSSQPGKRMNKMSLNSSSCRIFIFWADAVGAIELRRQQWFLLLLFFTRWWCCRRRLQWVSPAALLKDCWVASIFSPGDTETDPVLANRMVKHRWLISVLSCTFPCQQEMSARDIYSQVLRGLGREQRGDWFWPILDTFRC